METYDTQQIRICNNKKKLYISNKKLHPRVHTQAHQSQQPPAIPTQQPHPPNHRYKTRSLIRGWPTPTTKTRKAKPTTTQHVDRLVTSDDGCEFTPARRRRNKTTNYRLQRRRPEKGSWPLVHRASWWCLLLYGDGSVPEGGLVRICVGVGISAVKVNNSDSWKMRCWVCNADLPTRRQYVLNCIGLQTGLL